MEQIQLHRKTQRKIAGTIKGKAEVLLKKYFFSFSFIYMITFAFLSYFMDKNSIFLNTFGVVLIDFFANLIYSILYLYQSKRDAINIAYKNKKMSFPYKISLINKEISNNGMISGFKIIIFLLFVIIVLLPYYLIGGYLLHNVIFMSVSNAFNFVMFFISVAYFDMFFEGGLNKIAPNLKNIKFLTANDNLIKKIGFYLFIFAVMCYQGYTLINNLIMLATYLVKLCNKSM